MTNTTPEAATTPAPESTAGTTPKTGLAAMFAAAAATIGASLCCIGPLVLLSLGIGGAWVGTLTELTPYRPFFIGITALFLFMAFRKLYLLPRSCAVDATCAIPSTLRNQRIIFWVVTIVLIATLAFPYYGIYFFE